MRWAFFPRGLHMCVRGPVILKPGRIFLVCVF